MSILGLVPIIGKAIGKALGIVDKFVPDKDKATELKAQIETLILVQGHDELVKELEGQIQIILAEARGGWLQRNWRPMLMMVCILIIFNNYVLFPYLSMFTEKAVMLELPGGLWALLNLGVGGYIGGRTAEKIFKKD